MNAGIRRVLMGLILMLTACLVAIVVIRVDVPPQEPRLLILDAPGCEGARQLGLTPSPTEHGICELEAKAALTFRWVTIGKVDIRAEHLIAVRDVR